MSAPEPHWRPVARTRTYELVLDRIEEQLSTGALRVGDHLPPERDLAAALGVSRPAVREAVRVLEARGVVRSATGSGADAGTVVTALQSDAMTSLIRLHVALNTVSEPDLVRARIALERESAQLACRSADRGDHAALADLLARMDDPAIDVERFNDLDTAFHVRLAEASGNRLVADLTTALRTIMRPRLLAALTALRPRPAELRRVLDRLRREHHAIHEAVRGDDPAAAADAVEAHIAGFYLGAWRDAPAASGPADAPAAGGPADPPAAGGPADPPASGEPAAGSGTPADSAGEPADRGWSDRGERRPRGATRH